MQNLTFRDRLRISREMIFQICCSCALQHIENKEEEENEKEKEKEKEKE